MNLAPSGGVGGRWGRAAVVPIIAGERDVPKCGTSRVADMRTHENDEQDEQREPWQHAPTQARAAQMARKWGSDAAVYRSYDNVGRAQQVCECIAAELIDNDQAHERPADPLSSVLPGL
jgi:hypothetical protein